MLITKYFCGSPSSLGDVFLMFMIFLSLPVLICVMVLHQVVKLSNYYRKHISEGGRKLKVLYYASLFLVSVFVVSTAFVLF